MAIDSIIERILDQGRRQREAIISEARDQAERIVAAARQAAEIRYRDLLAEETRRITKRQQQRLIEVRLEIRREILQAKQEMLDRLFADLRTGLKKAQFKKKVVAHERVTEAAADIDYLVAKWRQDFTTEVAAILFS